MNKNILTYAAALLVGGSLVLTSCKKDETAPVITLTGDSVQTVSLNATYSDPGATANDEKDGDVSLNIDTVSNVNTNLVGTYTITYTVSDANANEATKTRTVIVRNDAYGVEGLYKYAETPDGGSATTGLDSVRIRISPSTTVNNTIIINKFAAYSNASVKVKIGASNALTIESQSMNCGTKNNLHTFFSHKNGIMNGNIITVYYDDNGAKYTGTYSKQ